MPTLIDRTGIRDDPWALFEGDAPDAIPAGVPLMVRAADWSVHRETLAARPGLLGLLLEPGDDPATIAGELDRFALLAVAFPKFTDGRGYSIARLLRERHGWRGELRAVGEVLRDQLHYLARCGFDSFALADGEDARAGLTAFEPFGEAYQGAADRGPLFLRRTAGAGAAP